MKYTELVDLYDQLATTSSKIRKTEILARFLEKIDDDTLLRKALLLIMGTVFPPWSEEEIGVATKLTIRAISRAYGVSEENIEAKWKEKGDLGLIVEEIATRKKQVTLFQRDLTVEKVYDNLKKAAEAEGEGSQERKIMYISELLIHATSKEAKYIVRTVLGDLRVGVAEGIVKDAIAKAYFTDIIWEALLTQPCGEGKSRYDLIFEEKGRRVWIEKPAYITLGRLSSLKLRRFMENNEVKLVEREEIEKLESLWKKKSNVDMIILVSAEKGSEMKQKIIDLLERAFALTNDLAHVAVVAKNEGEEGLRNVSLVLFRPIRVMLAQRAYSIREAFSTVGRPAALEYKYDGFRVQIHKDGDKVKIFTRRLEDVTRQFPDVVRAVRECIKADQCVVEGETIGYDKETKKWLPFQKISRRIRRKYDIEKMMKEIPTMTNLFDIIYLDGKLTIDLPFKERRTLLAKIVEEKPYEMVLAKQIITDRDEEAQRFFEEALSMGNEGIMFKNLDAAYKPGVRVGHMVKLKTTLETLDLVIVGAEWGEGKRSGWLTSYILACRDEDTGELLTIGKMSTGLKEKSEDGTTYEEMTRLLKPLIVKEKGKEVEVIPKIVVEVTYEEIQKSPHYTSGYALRFPRFVRLRTDKSVEEIDTLQRIEHLYRVQRHRNEGGGSDGK